jgi:hypothetical protein
MRPPTTGAKRREYGAGWGYPLPVVQGGHRDPLLHDFNVVARRANFLDVHQGLGDAPKKTRRAWVRTASRWKLRHFALLGAGCGLMLLPPIPADTKAGSVGMEAGPLLPSWRECLAALDRSLGRSSALSLICVTVDVRQGGVPLSFGSAWVAAGGTRRGLIHGGLHSRLRHSLRRRSSRRGKSPPPGTACRDGHSIVVRHGLHHHCVQQSRDREFESHRTMGTCPA